jgi:hypothetical protein
MLGRLLCVVLAASSLVMGASTAAGQVNDLCSVPRSLERVRPDADGDPIPVKIGVLLIDVVDVNELQESFKVDFLLSMSWRDPRLSAAARGGPMDDCVLGLEDVWDPDVHPVNQRGVTRDRARDVDIAEDGTVNFSERILGELSTALDLQDFPFDTQRLTIKLASFEYGPEDMILIEDEATTGRVDDLFVGGWDVVSNSTDPETAVLSVNAQKHTRLDHTIVVARRWGYFIWKFVLPLSFIVLMAWSAFWIDPDAIGPQVGVATASVFSLVAFLIGLRGVLPPVDYLTRIDELVISATVLVFLALGEAIITTRLAMNGRREAAVRIDRRTRWVYLGLFVVALIVHLII